MNKKGYALLLFSIISFSLNIFLFKRVVDWQEAWSEQIVTTSYIEQLFRSSSADTSFEAVSALVENNISSYELVPVVDSFNLDFGMDGEAILFQGTRLYFKNGDFMGSKADLPEHLVHWRLNE